MSDWPIQRRFPRYPIEVPFQLSTTAPGSSGGGVGWTRDLSEGGACVELNVRLPVPSPLHIHLLTDRGAIEIEAQVVWEAQAPVGGAQGSAQATGGVRYGVAFTHLAPDQLQTIRTLLAPRGQERRSGIRLPIDVPVTCQPKGPGGSPLQGRTGNMSRGGLLLRLSHAVPPGTELELTLHPPHGQVRAEGEVVWVEPLEKRSPGEPVRHGVRFNALGWSKALSLALLLTEDT
jgi:hypothetical protein